MNSILNTFTDSIFPRTCPVCGEIVVPAGRLICRSCLDSLSFVRAPVCEKCGKQVLTYSQHLCYDCTHMPKTYMVNRALLNYDETARKCMVGIKYKNCREHAELFGKMMAYRLKQYITDVAPDCLVPVPVHSSRYKARRYNQAELIAEVIGRELGIPVRTDILFRVKHTEAMKKLDPEERLKNLEEAFSVNTEVISNKISKVMLVDDIYTTGATIEACSKILCSYGLKTASICVCIGSDI